jgi:hypothetical protein
VLMAMRNIEPPTSQPLMGMRGGLFDCVRG